MKRAADGGTLEDVVVAYVHFATRHPALYWLTAERPFDPTLERLLGRRPTPVRDVLARKLET